MICLLVLWAVLAQSAAPVPDNTHAQALAFYRKHDYAPAVEAFRKALETEKPGTPEHEESLLLVGQSLYLTNKPDEAAVYLEKAQKTNEVLYMLGSVYLRSRNLPKAEAAFAALYGVEAASPSAHLVTAQLMMRQDYVEEASKELEQTIALNPKLPQAHYILGEIAMARGNADEAIRLLNEEISLNPDSSMAYYKLGDAYSRKQGWTDAVKFLQRSVWLNPDFSGPYILLGRSYLKMNELANAEGVLRHAVQIDPKNYSAHYLLGQTLMQLGREDEGRQMLELSQKLKPQ